MTSLRFLPLFLVLLLGPMTWAQEKDDPKKKKSQTFEGLKALKHPDAKVRYKAAQTLANVGPLAKFAVPELRETLQDSNKVVRVKAVEALWKIEQTSPQVLLPVLLDALKDKDAGVRAAAAPVIALLGTKAKTALPALKDALKDKELDVKLAAVVALGDLGPVAKSSADDLLALTDDPNFFLLEPFVGASLGNLGESVVPKLAKVLSEKSPERRRVAAYALGSMGASAAPAAAELAKALDVDDAATRQHAARALGRIGPDARSALPALAQRVTDKDVAVRIEAALATWRVGKNAQHVAVIVKALGDKSISVKDSACQALASMKSGARDAVGPVADLLDDKDLRLRAIITLGEIGPPESKPVTAKLVKLLDDKDGEIQLWSSFALWQISGDAKRTLKVLNETLGTEKHYTQSIIQLGEMGDAAKSMLPTLVNLYREEDIAADRQALAIAIRKIDPALAQKLGIR
ncbi:MAG TPA: HEAT repeat domain-containing protein [Gemmataceae bacterium]|nr:HEAT repeat domain-containing protein [Gemmataceae bacterium]